ncbi:hypothetical protein KKC1_26750 [Calderihabitans maritimus]|uniref:Uncharacterized protein n=1 Tax=Calderihabitans maritimus TaxID=1246530 RepID=A0A1Z5HVK2_9FIRM|nr:hypothetical protein KKC1_26750 [Calderihabitans maritimus]
MRKAFSSNMRKYETKTSHYVIIDLFLDAVEGGETGGS